MASLAVPGPGRPHTRPLPLPNLPSAQGGPCRRPPPTAAAANGCPTAVPAHDRPRHQPSLPAAEPSHGRTRPWRPRPSPAPAVLTHGRSRPRNRPSPSPSTSPSLASAPAVVCRPRPRPAPDPSHLQGNEVNGRSVRVGVGEQNKTEELTFLPPFPLGPVDCWGEGRRAVLEEGGAQWREGVLRRAARPPPQHIFWPGSPRGRPYSQMSQR